ncbi:MAG: hypothetical protein ISR58_06010 [Anaerolineales bacterium]|nr:hypothetical protein [Chloroflexota bacterium]MBL6980731.1 hypothetical protein [Anaerolineales bacterium]
MKYPFLGMELFLFGLLLSFVATTLILGYFASLNDAFTARFKNGIRMVHPLVDNHAFWVILLIILIGYAYRNSLEGYLLKDDDLFIISWARDGNPLVTFVEQPEIYLRYYRPIQYIILWVNYQLFGLNYAGHQTFILFQHIIISLMLYCFIYRVTNEKIHSFVITLMFSTHIYVSSIVVWTSAVVSSLGLVIVVSLFYIYRLKNTVVWYSIMSVLLFSAMFMHEMGMVVLFSLGLFAMYARYEKKITTRHLVGIFALVFMVSICYLLLRWKSVGILPQGKSLSTGYFFEYYENPETLGIKLYVYTVVANIVSNFFPIFSNVGIINTSRILIITFGIVLSFFTPQIMRKYFGEDGKVTLLLFGILLILGYILFRLSGGINFALSSSIQSILSIFIFYLITKWEKLSSTQKTIIIYALGLIIGSSIAAFPYFRWRTHYPGVIGWTILLSIAAHYIKNNLYFGKYINFFIIFIALIMIWGYSAELNSRLPRVTIEYAKYLCHPSLPDDFVDEVVKAYEINANIIKECR